MFLVFDWWLDVIWLKSHRNATNCIDFNIVIRILNTQVSAKMAQGQRKWHVVIGNCAKETLIDAFCYLCHIVGQCGYFFIVETRIKFVLLCIYVHVRLCKIVSDNTDIGKNIADIKGFTSNIWIGRVLLHIATELFRYMMTS